MQWTDYQREAPFGKYAQIQGLDPLADWLFDPGRQDFLPTNDKTLIPLIMNLHDEEGVRLIQQLLNEDQLDPLLFVPAHHAASLIPNKYFLAFAKIEFFDRILEDADGPFASLRSVKKEIKLSCPLPQQALPPLAQPIISSVAPPIGPPDGGWPQAAGKTVVIGIIDDGIAFAHERFRLSDNTTRVQCFWRQDGPYHGNGFTVPYGSEICKPTIDTLLQECTQHGLLDEDEFYRRAELLNYSESQELSHKAAAWRAAHGTHVLDIAAGARPADNVTDRPIIAVQLKTVTTADTSGCDLSAHVLEAINYILRRAAVLGKDGPPLPVVINFSYGLIAGSHDGSSELERFMDHTIAHPPAGVGPVRIVLPAGNSHLSRCHAAISFNLFNTEHILRWRVQPDDKTHSYLQLWMPYQKDWTPDVQDRIQISVTAPDGARSAWLGEVHNTGVYLLDDKGAIRAAANYFFRAAPTKRGVFQIVLLPTARIDSADSLAPSGIWEIKLKAVSISSSSEVQAWIQRDDSLYGYPARGRQSYFDMACYARFDAQGFIIETDDHPEQPSCLIQRTGLVNAIATGQNTIVIGGVQVRGGYRNQHLRTAPYSAGGPISTTNDQTPDENLRKPDALAISGDSTVFTGVLAAGTRNGSVVAFTGTSMAAPQIARWLADQLAQSNNGDRHAVKALAQANEGTIGGVIPVAAADRDGWGRIIDQAPKTVVLPRFRP